MKKILFSMLVCSLALAGCKNEGKVTDGEGTMGETSELASDGTEYSEAADGAEAASEAEGAGNAQSAKGFPIPTTLAEALPPKGEISTMLPQFTNLGYRMFEIEGVAGSFVGEDGKSIIHMLRLVCYEETDKQSEKREDGGRTDSAEGRLVVDAYDPKTKAFAGRYDGTYSMVADFAADGEFEHGGESYGGTFTDANGKKKEFSFFGD